MSIRLADCIFPIINQVIMMMAILCLHHLSRGVIEYMVFAITSSDHCKPEPSAGVSDVGYGTLAVLSDQVGYNCAAGLRLIMELQSCHREQYGTTSHHRNARLRVDPKWPLFIL
jgi:hypothetical protein